MSWDIVLFNSTQKIESIANLDENQLVSIDFSEILENSFNHIITDDNHREIIGNDFTICFFLDEKCNSNFMLNLYGENGLFELIKIAKEQNWQIYDSATDGMIDLEEPEKNGFKNYKYYVSQIMKNMQNK